MTISARARLFALQMDAIDPEAFATAAALEEVDRQGLGELARERLSDPKPRRVPLFAFVAMDAWTEIVALAVRLASATKTRKAATDALEEAAYEAPEILLPHLATLADFGVDARRVKSWERLVRAPRPAALHLVFDREAAPTRWPHPTQGPADPELPRLRFGGAVQGKCGFCHGPLHHLVTFEANALPILRKRIVLATCLSCLGWEQPFGEYTLAFRHDANGFPTPMQTLDAPITPQFPTRPFRELEIGLLDAGPRFALQDWGNSNHGQNQHRIGGAPSWVQSEEVLPCPSCALPMQHLLQLDSRLPQDDGGEFMWGSGGVLYVQRCEACNVSAMFWQCT